MMRTLTPVLSIIIAVLLYLFFTQTQFAEIKALQKETEDYASASEQAGAFRALLQQKLSIKNNQSVYDSERLEKFIPGTLDSARILTDLQKITQNSNLLFGNIKVKGGDTVVSTDTNTNESEVTEELDIMDVSFEVIGTYEQFKNFLRDLERSLTLFEVIDLKYSVTEDSPFQQFAMTVRSYGLPKSQ